VLSPYKVGCRVAVCFFCSIVRSFVRSFVVVVVLVVLIVLSSIAPTDSQVTSAQIDVRHVTQVSCATDHTVVVARKK
jgi:hypothetical protein